MIRLKHIRLGSWLLSIILLSGLIGYRVGYYRQTKEATLPNKQLEQSADYINNNPLDLSLFWDVWSRIGKDYLGRKDINKQQMTYGAIRGLVAALEDPYSVFLTPDDNQMAKDDLSGSFSGVGIELDYNSNGEMVVVAPLADMPAEKAGVKSGDIILEVDRKSTADLSLPEVVKLIRGPNGSNVLLTLRHSAEIQTYEVSLARTTISVPSVELASRDNVAIISLRRFGDNTNLDWDKLVTEIVNGSNKYKGLVVDLRNNPGGYLSGAVYIASEFITSGVVVQQEDGEGIRQAYSVERQGRLPKIPLVILVNKGSASASEIVAGALQEYKRATIIGETTFGKGTIQEAQELVEGAGLHLTYARWLLPSGKSINKTGVKPDVVIEAKEEPNEKDIQLEKAIEVIKTK